jgi:Ca-activated chloride channel family protein
VLARIKQAWRADRKPANVAIVVDVSGSRQDESKLAHAREGLRLFSPRDRVGLVTFSDIVSVIRPIAEMRTQRTALQRSVDDLVAGGRTAVYDATLRGVDLVASLRDPTRINAVIVLIDREDNQSVVNTTQLLDALRARSESDQGAIRIFTIAYGSDADTVALTDIANASGLGLIHAQIVQASVADDSLAQRRVADQVRELCDEVDAALGALDDADAD